VRAASAERTPVETVAKVRTYSSTDKEMMVIDFGLPRTVSAITMPEGVTVESVATWTGAAFGTAKFLPATSHAVLSEVRTERLELKISAAVPNLTKMFLELPDAPSDLELRINGGAPVWTHPGAVQPGPDAARTTAAWNKASERIVPLADALNALLGDPLSDAPATFEITLTTKVPGVLKVEEDGEAPYGRRVSFIKRVLFANDAAKTLDFAEEGELTIPLSFAPGPVRVQEVRFSALANLPPERILPPVGPDAAGTAAASPLAELVLDPQHAACVRLSGRSDLAQLTGVRLPLKAEGDGAEMSVVLWENKASAVQPSEPLSGGTSTPVTLDAGKAEAWTRFDFAKPVPIDNHNPPWLAVLVSRGTVTWAMAARPSGTELVTDNILRRGAPNGPWIALPLPFLDPDPESPTAPLPLLRAAGRVRMIGTADKTKPVAPLQIGVLTASAEVTPTPKGVLVSIPCDAPLPAGETALAVISRTAGSVTLRDIDVIWRNS
jgi:hypothetical protein